MAMNQPQDLTNICIFVLTLYNFDFNPDKC